MDIRQRLRRCLSNRQLVMKPQGKVPNRAGPKKRVSEPTGVLMSQTPKRTHVESDISLANVIDTRRLNG